MPAVRKRLPAPAMELVAHNHFEALCQENFAVKANAMRRRINGPMRFPEGVQND